MLPGVSHACCFAKVLCALRFGDSCLGYRRHIWRLLCVRLAGRYRIRRSITSHAGSAPAPAWDHRGESPAARGSARVPTVTPPASSPELNQLRMGSGLDRPTHTPKTRHGALDNCVRAAFAQKQGKRARVPQAVFSTSTPPLTFSVVAEERLRCCGAHLLRRCCWLCRLISAWRVRPRGEAASPAESGTCAVNDQEHGHLESPRGTHQLTQHVRICGAKEPATSCTLEQRRRPSYT